MALLSHHYRSVSLVHSYGTANTAIQIIPVRRSHWTFDRRKLGKFIPFTISTLKLSDSPMPGGEIADERDLGLRNHRFRFRMNRFTRRKIRFCSKLFRPRMLSRNTLLLAQRLDFGKPSSAVGSKKKRLVLRSLSESDVLHKILLRKSRV